VSETKPRVEQVALSHLLNNAYEEFKLSVHSASARFVLWGSFRDAADLKQHYFAAKNKKHILDGRRSAKSFSPSDSNLKEVVELGAAEAEAYVDWVREQNGQPILREMLVSYCTVFENCLKNVALVFLLANKKKQGLGGLVFVPGDEFRKALHSIQDRWRTAGSAEKSRAEQFFDSNIQSVNVDCSRFKFLPMSAPEWSTCRAAYQSRNALVHQLGRPIETLEIDGTPLPAGWEIQLTPAQLLAVQRSFEKILWPLDPLNQL
jgi:hypothetical protein